jgi:tetratricopeptide (TPR) repeat protein
MKTRRQKPIQKDVDPEFSCTRWKDVRVLVCIAVVLCVTFAAYIPSLKNGFTNWDDQHYVTDNAMIRGLSMDHLRQIASTPVRANYHPITMLSLALNYRFSGLDPWAYHSTNLALHLINVVLVFWFVFLITKGSLITAAITSMFFGIHPMHVESVAWVSERKDVLYTLFFTAGLIGFVRFQENRKASTYLLTLILFGIALLSKPAAVVFPLVLLLLDYLAQRRLRFRVLAEKGPFFLLALIFGLIAIRVQSHAIQNLDSFSLLHRAVFASYGFVVYIFKLFVPTRLSTFYPYPNIQAGLPVVFKVAPLIVLAIGALTIWSMRRTRIVVFGILFYTINLLLVLQFLPVGGAITADRYTYVPYVGLFFIIGRAFAWLCRHGRRKSAPLRYGFGVVLLVFALTWTTTAYERTKVWIDSETLWTDVISNYPNVPYAYNNRGVFYQYTKDEPERALADYSMAISLKSNYADAYENRGALYYEHEDYEEALADYDNFIALRPDDPKGYFHRGNIYFVGLERYDEALADYDIVLRHNPGNYHAHNNRGAIFFNYRRDYSRALEEFEQAIAINPDYGASFLNRSRAYYALGNIEQAIADAEKGIELGGTVDESYMDLLKQAATR